MSDSIPDERRRFYRVSVDIPIEYKLLSQDPSLPVASPLQKGYTRDLSQGGLLMIGALQNFGWVQAMKAGRIVVAARMTLPHDPVSILALCRVAWMEAVEAQSGHAEFGLVFQEITNSDRERLLRYVIESQLADV